MAKRISLNAPIKKWGITAKILLISLIMSLVIASVSFADGGGRYQVDPWAFGVHGDTQWTVDGNLEDNPNYVAVAAINALNQKFIDADVKFVIQVGDLSDRAGDAAMATRAQAAQSLYDEEIGFFPLRGNHETYGWMYFLDPDSNLNIPAFKNNFPQTQGLSNTFGATNFSSPSSTNDIMKGLSYSFDYGEQGNNAKFVIVDVEATTVVPSTPASHPTYGAGAFYFGFTVYKHTSDLQGTTGAYVGDVWSKVPATIPAGEYFRISGGKPTTDFYGWNNGIVTKYNADGNIWPIADYLTYVSAALSGEYWPNQQQEWVSERLDKATRGTEHAFVFSHRPMMGANHTDYFFGPEYKPELDPAENAFYASLANNDVKYMISGHDHIYNRALLASPDGLSKVEQLISIGASSKFYSPAGINTFPGDVKNREMQISQEINNIGYYLYTIDGPRVTVEYYSDFFGDFKDGDKYPDGTGSLEAPDFDFEKKETWGYSQNGQQFIVAQGGSYTVVSDSFEGTHAKILAGANSSTSTDLTPYNTDETGGGPRALNKTVNTGWVAKAEADKPCCDKHQRGRGCKNHHQSCKTCKNLKSDILSIWGMSELGADDQTDEYVISMSFDFNKMVHLGNGGIGIATFVDGEWVNAVGENFGEGKKKFVVGPYKSKYGLGTYGVDPSTKTAWAVLDYNADFAVVDDIKIVPRHGHGHGR